MRAFLIGFPKAGTCSIDRALTESGLFCIHSKDRQTRRHVGQTIYENWFAGGDIFAGLKRYDAVTQADVTSPRRNLVFWPQLDLAILRRIKEQYPDCRLILNKRELEPHITSMQRWNTFQSRLIKSDVPGLPYGFGRTADQLKHWICGHYANLAASDIPFATVNIDRESAQDELAAAVGQKILWWGVENKNIKTAQNNR